MLGLQYLFLGYTAPRAKTLPLAILIGGVYARIPTMSAAYSDASRPAIPVDVGRVFRLKSATP